MLSPPLQLVVPSLCKGGDIAVSTRSTLRTSAHSGGLQVLGRCLSFPPSPPVAVAPTTHPTSRCLQCWLSPTIRHLVVCQWFCPLSSSFRPTSSGSRDWGQVVHRLVSWLGPDAVSGLYSISGGKWVSSVV